MRVQPTLVKKIKLVQGRDSSLMKIMDEVHEGKRPVYNFGDKNFIRGEEYNPPSSKKKNVVSFCLDPRSPPTSYLPTTEPCKISLPLGRVPLPLILSSFLLFYFKTQTQKHTTLLSFSLTLSHRSPLLTTTSTIFSGKVYQKTPHEKS